MRLRQVKLDDRKSPARCHVALGRRLVRVTAERNALAEEVWAGVPDGHIGKCINWALQSQLRRDRFRHGFAHDNIRYHSDDRDYDVVTTPAPDIGWGA